MPLTADVIPMPRPDPAYPVIEREYPCEAAGAEIWYRGSVVCQSVGLLVNDNADADLTIGFCTEHLATAAANTPVKVAITGIWWVAAVALTDAGLLTATYPLAGSDDPAEINLTTLTNPSALGLLVHVDATAVSGWIHLGIKSNPTNS